MNEISKIPNINSTNIRKQNNSNLARNKLYLSHLRKFGSDLLYFSDYDIKAWDAQEKFAASQATCWMQTIYEALHLWNLKTTFRNALIHVTWALGSLIYARIRIKISNHKPRANKMIFWSYVN